ncbi:hypothetical protein [Actinomadura sp. SCN-SB]
MTDGNPNAAREPVIDGSVPDATAAYDEARTVPDRADGRVRGHLGDARS